MSNREKLKELLLAVFLLDESEFRYDLRRDEISAWDSLGIVALAVGIQETFGYHLSPEEAMHIKSVTDIITLLGEKGITFE
jgi:acyl carrier protein